MDRLDLNNLKNNKNEILKAEIVSLFSLLEKTYTEWWKKRGFFSSYANKISNINGDLEFLLANFKNINFNLKLKYHNKSISLINAFNDFINPKWRSWRDIELKDKPEKFLQILYGSCEGLNSGIEKGSPLKRNQISDISERPLLSSSFGALIQTIDENKLNTLREILFFKNLKNELMEKDKESFNNQKVLAKNLSGIIKELTNNSISIWKLLRIRIILYNLFYFFYKKIPSDSRFPANDTSVFDQAYMATTLFKAALSGSLLSSSSGEVNIADFNPQTIKWSIFGIQYDKLGLAEKGLKVASIKWYRDKSREADNKVKYLIEIKYALGNEIYRDETGIYFIVPENIIGKYNNGFYNLYNDFLEIQTNIQRIFNKIFDGEIYPAIFLTEPSRGLMNLGHLIEKAKENFLKAEYPKEFRDKLNTKGDLNANGVCQVCGMSLGHRREDGNFICDVCERRLKSRVKNWLRNLLGETVWLSELQDKNGRIALVVLKFELEQWLNGNLVNTLIIRGERYNNTVNIIKEMLSIIKRELNKDEIKKLDLDRNEIQVFYSFVSLFDKEAFQDPFESIHKQLEKDKSIGNITKDKGWRKITERLLKENKEWLEDFAFFNKKNNYIIKNKKKNKVESFSDYYEKNGCKEHLYKLFIINYARLLINLLLLERSIGSQWEKIILKKLNDWDNNRKQPLSQKIDFHNRKIHWDNLNSDDIDFLSQILLQFLLRKNPSPARLKRIWDTTREFFEEISSEIINILEVPKWRQQRVVFEIESSEIKKIENKEYIHKGLQYWKYGNKLYLIDSIEQFLKIFYPKALKKLYENEKINFELSDEIFENLKKQEWQIEESLEINRTPKKYNIKISNIKIETYKPVLSIIDPTPISWQLAIPAEYLPNLIEKIKEEYIKHFKYVYGKLPLHIGVVVQDYKKPLYVGIQALRKIRRDKVKWEDLREEIERKDLKLKQDEVLKFATKEEENNNTKDFYSYYELKSGRGKYNFYIYPRADGEYWIDTVENGDDKDIFYIYPNTFDFEFMDTNTRRNDIYYEKGKRVNKWKRLRPFNLDEWGRFKVFKAYFKSNKSSSKLQKLISLIYSKLEEWDDSEAIKQFMLSAFINILELKKDDKDDFAKILGVDSFENLKDIEPEEFRRKLLSLIDMFEFWHTALKEV